MIKRISGLFPFLLILSFSYCGPVKSDSGALTTSELESAGTKIGDKIAKHFKENPVEGGVFVALLATRNDTSEQIPTEIFDSALVKTLMKNKIYTIKVDARQDQLKQIKWDQQMGIGQFNLGNLKSPNYFVKSKIDENMFRSDGKKVVEQSLNVEFIHLESLVVMVSEKETFSKKAKDNQGLGW